MLQIQSKRFYLDVKQNKRGKFIKVEKRLSLLARAAVLTYFSATQIKVQIILSSSRQRRDSSCLPAVLTNFSSTQIKVQMIQSSSRQRGYSPYFPAVLKTDSDSAPGLNLILRWLKSALMDGGLKSSWRYPLQVDQLETLTCIKACLVKSFYARNSCPI